MPKIEALQNIKKLIVFLEKYADSNPEFAQLINEEFGSDGKPKTKASAKRKVVAAADPFKLIEELGEEGFKTHLAGVDHDTAVGFAKFLSIRGKRKPEEIDALKDKIMQEVAKSLGHGQAFTKPSRGKKAASLITATEE